MYRRALIKGMIASALLSGVSSRDAAAKTFGSKPKMRVRPGDPDWPSANAWDKLRRDTGGRLLQPESPFLTCASTEGTSCAEALKQLKNPFYLGDQVALTQTSGWAAAWTSHPSVYAVAAESTADVVAAVNFARDRRLRLVVKGGGHSYQGTSCAPDSLLVWMRRLNDVKLHDAFVSRGCEGKQAPQPAVTLGAGSMWIDAYDAVTTHGARYVQGGGCTTVGVAGLLQGGGFGSFSKAYGTAAAGLLEAEIVTADGTVRTANACTHPDLFWAIKGGGGSTFGVITRLTLRTRDLPEYFGAVFGNIKAASDTAYRTLIAKALSFYQSDLFNPHWGEQMTFQMDNTLRLSMVFHGLTQQQAQAAWTPFIEWARSNKEYSFGSELRVISLPARRFWDAEFLKKNAPALVVSDDRTGAPSHHILWAGDQAQVGWYIHGYKSAWLPASLLDEDRQSALVDAVFAATRQWEISLHFNKGLAGANREEIEAARNTSTNPKMLDAFALVIAGQGGAPAFAGMPNSPVNSVVDSIAADRIGKAMDELLRVAPAAGSYVSESDYFEPNWQTSFWGTHYPALLKIKSKYDPQGLFFSHHGIGSEDWSADGFTRLGS